MEERQRHDIGSGVSRRVDGRLSHLGHVVVIDLNVHDNIEIDKNDATRKLYFASMLMYKLDEA